MMLMPALEDGSQFKKTRQNALDEIAFASASSGVTQLLARLTNFDARYNDGSVATPELLEQVKWADVQGHLQGTHVPGQCDRHCDR